MCNENKDKEVNKETYDYRFFDYRLDKLEQELQKGLQKIERDYADNNKELMKMLQIVQENNNEQNKTLVELSQRQKSIEEQMQCVDRLKEVATENRTRIKEVERRLQIYQQILFGIGIGVIVALIKAFVFNI